MRSRTRSFLNALLEGDPASASRVVDQELADLGSRAAVFADLIHPTQYEIGELWYRGESAWRTSTVPPPVEFLLRVK